MRCADTVFNPSVHLGRRSLPVQGTRIEIRPNFHTLRAVASNQHQRIRVAGVSGGQVAIDLRVGSAPYPVVYNLFDGSVVEQRLDMTNKRSTLVVESTIRGTKYRLYYSHCSEHFVREGATASKGSSICWAGSVGADAPHMHIDAKREGTSDFSNLRALSGSHCNTGVCYDSNVKSLTVDPVDLISLDNSSATDFADTHIDRCMSKFVDYFGSKRGQSFVDSGGYKIQDTTGGPVGLVEAIAIATSASDISTAVVWYYWGGWGYLPLSVCE